MCEFVVCIRNEPATGNLVWDSRRPKQGDVIEARDDGFQFWGNAVNGIIQPGDPNGNHPQWRLFKAPAISMSQISVMLAQEIDVDPQKPSPYLQYRAFFLDKTKIPAGTLAAFWLDNTRSQLSFTLPYTAAQLNTIKTQRTPVQF